jgi:flavin-binding protein dodecin
MASWDTSVTAPRHLGGHRVRASGPGHQIKACAVRCFTETIGAVHHSHHVPAGQDTVGRDQTHASQTSAVEAPEGNIMSVYRVTELIGTSETSWEKAAVTALKRASNTLRDLRVAEVVKQDVQINDGGTVTYRIKLQVSFKYEADGTD